MSQTLGWACKHFYWVSRITFTSLTTASLKDTWNCVMSYFYRKSCLTIYRGNDDQLHIVNGQLTAWVPFILKGNKVCHQSSCLKYHLFDGFERFLYSLKWSLVCLTFSGMFGQSKQFTMFRLCGDSGSESGGGPSSGEWRFYGGGVHGLALAEPRRRTGLALVKLLQ